MQEEKMSVDFKKREGKKNGGKKVHGKVRLSENNQFF